jgi:hypothetical protein
MNVFKSLAFVAGLSLLVPGLGFAQASLGSSANSNEVAFGVEIGEPVTPVGIDVDLRSLPVQPEWRPGDSVREAAKRQYYPLEGRVLPHAAAEKPTAVDGLSELQQIWDNLSGARSDGANGERVSINNGSTGVSPGDPVVDVNGNYVVYGINASTGTAFTIYNKAGTKLAGPTSFKSLAPAGDPCATSVSDPIVLYDRIANRWFMLEMGGTTSANRLCTYVSKTDNPVTGGWWFYGFATPALPDYPHCGVWHNAYVCTANESGSGAKIYAFDRANMLNGATARAAQRFTSVAKLAGYGFQALTPATLMGNTAPPASSAVILARHNDDEAHAGGSANGSADFIDLYGLNINWNTPSSSSVTTLPRITITEYNSWLRDYSTFASIPQPGSTSRLDPIREVIMNLLTYRNMGSYESIVGNFVTNQNAARTGTTVDAGIRWFELRRTGTGNWALHQEGTFGPGDNSTHHFLGALATDKMGNIGMSYNVTKTTSPTVFATLRRTGRLITDPLGVMTQGETDIAAGSAVETSGRWGDYHQTVVDPSDDCTFWTVGLYRPSGSWNTRISDFKFSNCTGGTTPTYSISGTITTSAGVGINGVSVSTGGSSTTTNSSGVYTIANLAAGSYTLTPSLSGYSFSPVNRAVSITSANVTGQNFTGTPPASTYSITGTITTSSGTAISGVSVSRGAASVATNSSGVYTFTGVANGSYTITPSLTGYTFSPVNRSVSVSGANVSGQNFTGTPPTSGNALSNGVPVNSSVNSTSANSDFKEFTVAIPSGASNLNIATTNASGDIDLYVRFGASPGTASGQYDCRPYTGSGNETCSFATPSVGTYYVRVYGYATGTQSFTLTASWGSAPSTYSITGSITTSTGTAISGVTVSRGGATTTTDSSGVYTFTGLANGSYTITPSLTNYTFSPTSRSVSVSGANVSSQNFTGSTASQPSFFQNQTNYNITDNGTINSPITVSGRSGNAPSNLQVSVRIIHTYIGDLQVYLIAPDGTSRTLHNRSGGGTDNIITTYTVNASSELANGTWQLRVRDRANGDTGYLDEWSMQF